MTTLMRVSHHIWVTALVFVVVSCSRQRFDPIAEGERLLQRDAEWANLATAGKDIEKIVSYWSDDAVLIFPGQPVLEGKTAIRAYVTSSLNTPGFKIHWVSQKPVFSPDGKFAYMRATDELTSAWAQRHLDVSTSSRPIRLASRSRRQRYCVMDIANEEPLATPK